MGGTVGWYSPQPIHLCCSCGTHLVIRDLLQIQMGVVLDVQSGVAVVVTVVGSPGESDRLERVNSFVAALRSRHNCHKMTAAPSDVT